MLLEGMFLGSFSKAYTCTCHISHFQPPRIGGVKVYTEHVKRDEIYMDLDIM